MSTSLLSKDAKIESLQIRQEDLLVIANLVTASSDGEGIVEIDNSTLSATVINIDIKEPVKKVQKVQVINRATGESIALAAAPVVTDTSVDGKVVSSSISVTCDGAPGASVCIHVSYSK